MLLEFLELDLSVCLCVCVCVYAICREENMGCIKLAQTCERIWAVKLLALPRNIRKVAGSVTDQDTDCCLQRFVLRHC